MLMDKNKSKPFPLLGTELLYHANSAKNFFIVLSPNIAALSRGCKPRIGYVGQNPLGAHYKWLEGKGQEVLIKLLFNA